MSAHRDKRDQAVRPQEQNRLGRLGLLSSLGPGFPRSAPTIALPAGVKLPPRRAPEPLEFPAAAFSAVEGEIAFVEYDSSGGLYHHYVRSAASHPGPRRRAGRLCVA
jgi:hypothetical protein